MGHETTDSRAHLTFGVQDPKPEHPTEPVSRETIENVIRAAREVDAFVSADGPPFRFDGRSPSEDAQSALLSLHDYLNDVERETGGAL